MNLARVAGIAAVFGMLLPAQSQQGARGNREEQGKGKVEKPRAKQEKRAKPQKEQRTRQQQPRPSTAQRQQPQQERQAERAPSQQQGRQQPRARQQQSWTQPQMQRSQEEARAWQQQRGWIKQGGWKGQSTWRQARAQRWSSDHRTWTQRGGYGGYYIPQDRFRVSFGSQHHFRLRSQPVIYMGYPRFEYGGFAFLLVDPWPEYWADNWYDQDDVYIDYEDGYYLYNRRYPQVRLAITVSLN